MFLLLLGALLVGAKAAAANIPANDTARILKRI